MKRIPYIQIDIPEPCGEGWDTMTPVEGGRHCVQCSKTVIDFTTWTDRDLYNFFSSNKGHVCGRYLASQVGHPIQIPPQPHSRLYRMMIAMGLTLIFAGESAQAQYKPSVIPATLAKQASDSSPATAPTAGIKGAVVDEKKEPMISAAVQVFQDGILQGSAATDYDGNYVIKPLNTGVYTLLVQYTGYDSFTVKEIVVSDTIVAVNARMSPKAGFRQEITILGGPWPLVDKHPDNKPQPIKRKRKH